MSDGPTTGNAEVDAVIRTHMTEAIAIARQILVDRIPDIEPDNADKTSAILVSQIWRPIATMIARSIAIEGKEFTDAPPH